MSKKMQTVIYGSGISSSDDMRVSVMGLWTITVPKDLKYESVPDGIDRTNDGCCLKISRQNLMTVNSDDYKALQAKPSALNISAMLVESPRVFLDLPDYCSDNDVFPYLVKETDELIVRYGFERDMISFMVARKDSVVFTWVGGLTMLDTLYRPTIASERVAIAEQWLKTIEIVTVKEMTKLPNDNCYASVVAPSFKLKKMKNIGDGISVPIPDGCIDVTETLKMLPGNNPECTVFAASTSEDFYSIDDFASSDASIWVQKFNISGDLKIDVPSAVMIKFQTNISQKEDFLKYQVCPHKTANEVIIFDNLIDPNANRAFSNAIIWTKSGVAYYISIRIAFLASIYDDAMEWYAANTLTADWISRIQINGKKLNKLQKSETDLNTAEKEDDIDLSRSTVTSTRKTTSKKSDLKIKNIDQISFRKMTPDEFISINGCLLMFKKKVSGAVELPDGFTELGPTLFDEAEVYAVSIPNGVTKMYSITNNSHLEYVELPSTLSELASLRDCCNLKYIRLPDGLQKIGAFNFSKCVSLEEIIIPKSVKEIGNGAFYECSKLKYVELPDTLKRVAGFSECISLEEIVIPEGVEIIDEGAFRSCESLKAITLPSTLKTIGKNAFSYCKSLENISLPSSLETIQEGAFCSCYNLKTIVFPTSLKTIKENAFSYCKSLENVALPSSLETIESHALYACDSLKQIYVPTSVKEIGDFAFGLYTQNLVIYTDYGSFAETYATNNHIKISYEIDQYLTEDEREERRRREEEERLRREEEERKRREEEERKRREAEERRRKEAEERERKRQEELAAKRARYKELNDAIASQMQIIRENKGWFGAKANTRKMAQKQLESLQIQLVREFPFGLKE